MFVDSVLWVTYLRWLDRPAVKEPIVIASFEGWNDAGEAASQTVRLLERWLDATPFVDIDPEEFFDFTVVRPHIGSDGDGIRRIDWPENVFRVATPEGSPPIVLLCGIEPQLRWRAFSHCVLEVAQHLDARLVLTLGSLLAEVPHTRPSQVFGAAGNVEVSRILDYEPSRYEGPTGISGVLHELCATRGTHSASLWATVPSYVPSAPSPKATRALAVEVSRILGIDLPIEELDDDVEDYDRQITDMVSEDDDTVTYVAHLEERYDREALAGHSADALVSEVEAFLRDQ